MSEFRIDQIKSQDGKQGPNIAGITTFTGTSGIVMPSGDTAYRGGRGRGLVAAGVNSPTYFSQIDYVTIATLGNSVTFGDLTSQRNSPKGTSNSVRACFASGYNPSLSAYDNTIFYVTISSAGNGFDFGDLTTGAVGTFGTASNNIRGLYVGGAPSYIKTGQYITFTTLGNAIDFGDITFGSRNSSSGVLGSSTRAIFAGGDAPSIDYNIIEYTEYSSLGDTVKFGDLPSVRTNATSVTSGTRGVVMGGETPSRTNSCEYITISSLGNSQDFGDLTDDRRSATAFDNSVRGCCAGGDDSGSSGNNCNIIDYITIASTGDATDFGDISYGEVRNPAGASDSHGGIG